MVAPIRAESPLRCDEVIYKYWSYSQTVSINLKSLGGTQCVSGGASGTPVSAESDLTDTQKTALEFFYYYLNPRRRSNPFHNSALGSAAESGDMSLTPWAAGFTSHSIKLSLWSCPRYHLPLPLTSSWLFLFLSLPLEPDWPNLGEYGWSFVCFPSSSSVWYLFFS